MKLLRLRQTATLTRWTNKAAPKYQVALCAVNQRIPPHATTNRAKISRKFYANATIPAKQAPSYGIHAPRVAGRDGHHRPARGICGATLLRPDRKIRAEHREGAD